MRRNKKNIFIQLIQHVQRVSEMRNFQRATLLRWHNIECYKLKRFVEHPHRSSIDEFVSLHKLCHRQNYKKYEVVSVYTH